ncbi:MAG: radical SAM protein [Candidatus Atabeyarchaeum deiterrae]
MFETNIVKKDHRKVNLKMALCYPGPYRVGMSSLAVHTIYGMANSLREVACERAFMQSTPGTPVHTLESNAPLRKMDIIGFSLQYETDYVNLLRILIDSNIPLFSKHRKVEDPLVIAGGPCATGNPEPLSDFVDLFVIGEAEPVLPKLLDLVMGIKKPRNHLEELLDIEGLYIPSMDQDSIKRVWASDLDAAPHPTRQVITHTAQRSEHSPIFGETFLTEVTRGCSQGCRFCYIGYIARPNRERTSSNIREIIEQGTAHTGVGKVSLVGSSLSDCAHLADTCSWIVNDLGLKVSLSSMRADSVPIELLKTLAKGGERTLTIAPETGSESLRNSINKKITDDAIVQTAENALEAGLRNVKLYFMIGLPHERDEDIAAINGLVQRVAKLGYQSRSIRLSIVPFTPKPHTPFQWFQQAPKQDLQTKLRIIHSGLHLNNRVDIESLDLRWARIQAILSTANRGMGRILEQVAREGGTLGTWRRAMTMAASSLSTFEMERTTETPLPWDKIQIGINKGFLKTEMEKSVTGIQSPSCLTKCSNCGVC